MDISGNTYLVKGSVSRIEGLVVVDVRKKGYKEGERVSF